MFVFVATLTEVFPYFSLSCKANSRVKPAKTGHGRHSSQFLCCSMYFCVVLCIFVLFYALFVCICVLYYCHRVATQLQLNISHHIIQTSQLKLYREIIAICSQIHTKHINTAVWGERRIREC